MRVFSLDNFKILLLPCLNYQSIMLVYCKVNNLNDNGCILDTKSILLCLTLQSSLEMKCNLIHSPDWWISINILHY